MAAARCCFCICASAVSPYTSGTGVFGAVPSSDAVAVRPLGCGRPARHPSLAATASSCPAASGIVAAGNLPIKAQENTLPLVFHNGRLLW